MYKELYRLKTFRQLLYSVIRSIWKLGIFLYAGYLFFIRHDAQSAIYMLLVGLY